MRLPHTLRLTAGALLSVLLTFLALAVQAAPLIVLDPGHSPNGGGATSIDGTREVVYNDRFVAELAPALMRAGWRVKITRTAQENRGLAARPELANALDAVVFLSIHHDSAQPKYLQKIQKNGATAYETKEPIAGYSLYVSRDNPEFGESLHLAALLGERLRSLGRAPNLKHAEKIAGENRPLLDKRLGIYAYDPLAVLRHAKMPAVLLEVGVIVDRSDQAYVSNAANRQKMIKGIVAGLRAFINDEGISPASRRASPPLRLP